MNGLFQLNFLLQANVTNIEGDFLILGPEKDPTDRIPSKLFAKAKIGDRLLVKCVNNIPVAVLRVD